MGLAPLPPQLSERLWVGTKFLPPGSSTLSRVPSSCLLQANLCCEPTELWAPAGPRRAQTVPHYSTGHFWGS